MGTFSGHIMSGLPFLIYGIRWAYCLFRRYFLCRREMALMQGKSRKFQSSLTFPVSCCPGFPLEAVILFVAVVGIMAAESSAINRRGYLEVFQHLTMYFFYGAAAFFLILKHYRFPIVPDAEYVGFILSFVVNTFLMQRHLMHKSTLEVQVHQNSMVVMVVGALALTGEMVYRHNVILPLTRAFCFSLNGSWLVMEDFMLWSPWGKWPNEDHEWIMIATISFAAHIAGHLLLMGILSVIALTSVRSLTPNQVSMALDQEGLGSRGMIGRKTSALNSEQSEYLLVNSDDEV